MRSSGHKTELRVYALEGGAVLDGKELAVRLTTLPLANYDIEDVQLSRHEEEAALGSVEVAVLTMACLVFLGAFIAVLCICCIKMRRYGLLVVLFCWRLEIFVAVGWGDVGVVVVVGLVLDSLLIVLSPQYFHA